MTKNEPWDDPRITAYVMDELGGEDKAAFEDEMADSAELAAAVDEARTVTQALAGLFAAEPAPELDGDRRDAIVSGATVSNENRGWLRKAAIVLMATAASGILIGLMLPTTYSARETARRQSVDEVMARAEMTEATDETKVIEEEEQAQVEFVPEAWLSVADKSNGASPTPMLNKSPTVDPASAGYVRKMQMDFAAPSVKAIPQGALADNLGFLRRSELLQTRDGSVMLGATPRIMVQPEEVLSDFAFGRGEPSGDRFDPITDNAFQRVGEHPLSTFSVDVDTASYSKVRSVLLQYNQLPRPDAVRIEEMVNYFHYDYAAPDNDAPHPFTADVDITGCPWNAEHRLARIAIQGKTMKTKERPKSNLVFLIDTSGSMNEPNKLPLVVEGMKMLTKELGADDRVAIVVYAGSAGLVLDSTSAKKGKKIRKALTQLSAGGSTNGGAGVQLAYQTARENFIEGGVNRVILCSDGDFNVGTTGTDELVRMVERESKSGIFLTVLGFGMGNHNDAMMEQVSGRGNGNYAFIDTEAEAQKVLVDQISGTLVTIAKDVKLQVEFNPAKVSSYRLIGYENRILAKEDFNDDKKDAGEIGAGHSVTALYEIVPAGVDADALVPPVDDLKYQSQPKVTEAADSDEMLTVKLRYKQPDGDTSTLVDFPVIDGGAAFDAADADTKFAAAVAGFGMQLRRSEYAGSWTMTDVINVAKSAQGDDGLRSEFVTIAKKAAELMGAE